MNFFLETFVHSSEIDSTDQIMYEGAVHQMQTYFVGLKMGKVETLLFYYFFVQVLDL